MTLKKAKDVIKVEANALLNLGKRLDHRFLQALDLLEACQGRVVVAGMGKTGIIGRKIAATLSSTGTKSMFMHSAEAVHGDLGQVAKDDVLIIISNSGETEETTKLIPLLKRMNTKVIAMTGNIDSSLAKYSDVVLDIGVDEEGCPLGLAPMASTTATLVMGDALAACLIVRKKFKKEDFAFYHPGGALGKRLLLKVKDVMRKGNDYARVKENKKVKDVLLAITRARCGCACIINKNKELVGIFTDGDLRRHLKEGQTGLLNEPVSHAMTKRPRSVSEDQLAAEAFAILKEKKIDELPVLNSKGDLVGLLDVQDILKAGVV